MLIKTINLKVIPLLVLVHLYSCSEFAQKKTAAPTPSTATTTATTSATSGSKRFLKMKLAGVSDPQITKGTAFLFMLPDGWKYSGNIYWDFSSINFPARGELVVNNNDNSMQLHKYPMRAFILGTQMLAMSGFRQGSKYMGAYVENQMPQDTKSALLKEVYALNLLPAGFKITDTKVTPAPASTNPADIAAMRNNPQSTFFSDNILITGTFNKNGEEWKGYVLGNVNGLVNRSANYASWSVTPLVSLVKNDAHEKDNEKLADAVFQSMRPTRQFIEVQQQVIKMLSNQFYANQRTIAEISRNITRNSDAFLANIDKQYSSNNSAGNSASGNSDPFDQYIRGTENYKDPSGDVYELPANYNHAWKSTDGQVIMTDDVRYNPNEDMSVSNHTWEALGK